MLKTVVCCDACDTSIEVTTSPSKFPGRVWLHLGREMDAAGSMENVGEEVHLCHPCCVKVIQLSAKSKEFGHFDNAKLLKWIKEQFAMHTTS